MPFSAVFPTPNPPSWPFPTGETLNSGALTPDDMHALMQRLTCPMLGIRIDDTKPEGGGAYRQVRVGWQRQGQPAWAIDEDLAIIRCTTINTPFARTNDNNYKFNPVDGSTNIDQRWYTAVWNTHWSVYGPNCMSNARRILGAFQFDWVRTALAQLPPPYTSQIYTVPEWHPPTYVPELHAGQWWKRADLDLKFYELVIEDTTVQAAAALDINIITETGYEQAVHLQNPPTP